jgi:hypothetical protein
MGKMKFFNKYKTHISVAVMALAVLLFLDVIYQTQMHIRWRLWLPDSLVSQSASTQPTTDAAKDAGKVKPPSKPLKLHVSIKKRNIFMEPKPRGHGLKLTGVLGTFALFSDRGGKTISIEEGKSGNGVTVKLIDGYEVSIEYKGKPETMKLFKGNSSARPSIPSPPSTQATAKPIDKPTPTIMPVESVKPAVMTTVDNQKNLHRKGTTQPCATMP